MKKGSSSEVAAATVKVKNHHHDDSSSGGSMSTIVAKMFGCCLLALLIQTLVALFPSFVVNKVTHEKKGGIGSTDPHHSRAKTERVNELNGDGPEVPLPVVCAHRGVNDINKTEVNSTATALLSLCMEHRICCADYDVSSTNDGVLVVGTPSDVHQLFPVSGNTSEGYGEPQVRDYTWKDLQEKDPDGRFFTELRMIVDIATALKGLHDRKVFMTIEPKASNPRLRKSLIERMAPMLSPHPDMFAVIMRGEEEAPEDLRLKAETYLQNFTTTSTSLPATSGGGQDGNPRTLDQLGLNTKDRRNELNASQLPKKLQGLIHFAYTLRDRSLDELVDSTITRDQKAAATKGKASGEAHTAKHGKRTVSFVGGKAFPKENLIRALQMCSNLCPKRGPTWAKFIMPSHRFVKTCSNIRYAALRDFGQSFYKEHFGHCLRVNGPDHAKHILWVLDEQKDFYQLPGQYHPAFVVSNYPVTVRKKLMDGDIRL